MATNILISGTQTSARSESDIRYNYNNPDQVIGASNNNGGSTQAQFYSSDGGSTWGQTSLPSVSGDSFQSDPAVDWTSDGTAWSLTIGVNASLTDLVLRSFKSTDGGQNWTHDADLSGTQTGTDKPAIWVDHSPTSSFQNNIYATWHNGAEAFIARKKSTSSTWDAPLQISGSETTFTADGGDIKTNADGDVFVFWPNAGGTTLLMAKSTNGGTSFDALASTPTKIADSNGNFLIFIPAQSERGCLLYISGGCYKTSSLDMVYAVWADLAGGSGCSSNSNAPGSDVTSSCKTRVFFCSSSDGGAHWGTPVKLNNPSSLNDQFFPRLSVDETNGNLMVIYYDTIADSGRLKADVWMQSSVDNGATWTTAVKVTTAPSNETSDSDGGNQYGDYIGLTGYNGQFFACWTDSRNGGLEQIWGAPLAMPSISFQTNKSTYGVDEVTDSPSYSDAFCVVVENISPNALGTGTVPSLSGAFDNLVYNGTPITSVTEDHTGLLAFPTYELSGQPDIPQRIQFPYKVSFPNGAPVPPFPTPTGAAVYEPMTASISFTGRASGISNSAVFELVGGEDPYFTNVDPSADNVFWLSQDLRVFTITPGVPALSNALPGAPAFMPTGSTPFTQQDPTAAYGYIQGLLGYLNSHYASSGDPFPSMLDQGEALTGDSSVTPSFPNFADLLHPFISYNFAIARVRLKGAINHTASGVKVFFRLWNTQTIDTDYITATTYACNTDMAGFPSEPLPGTGNNTYPFFAGGDYSAATENLDYGMGGFNNKDIKITSGDTAYAYFGCFINVYDLSTQVNFTAAGTHHCMVAQIAYDLAPIPTPAGATISPENSDKLAQRNLQITPGDNPGPADAHRIPQSFDLRPSPVLGAGVNAPGFQGYPDELMIVWGDVPRGSVASIYWPQVQASTVLALASKMYATNFLSAADAHTLQCTVTEAVTYVPIPPGTGPNFAGLFTIDLPLGVRAGDSYKVLVRRIGTWRFSEKTPPPPPPQPQLRIAGRASLPPAARAWRYIIGTFQVTIPIATSKELLAPEETKLAILKWRLQQMSTSNRWYLVLKRLILYIEGRVKGLGGNPVLIPPSPNGYVPPAPVHGIHSHEHTGKVTGIIFDRFGDFEGFDFLTETGESLHFKGREREVEKLIYRAWEERIVVTIRVSPHDKHWPAAIIFRRPPTI